MCTNKHFKLLAIILKQIHTNILGVKSNKLVPTNIYGLSHTPAPTNKPTPRLVSVVCVFTESKSQHCRDRWAQGVIFPAGVRVFPAGNLQNPQEILTKTLINGQTL